MPDPIPTTDQPTTTISAPVETSVSTSTTPNDPWIARFVAFFLGATMLLSVLGGFVTWAITKELPPEGLFAIGLTAGGALAAFMSKPHQ